MIRKTTQAYQVNQPRPASLPAYVTEKAWAFLEALSPDLCVTLMIERCTDDEKPNSLPDTCVYVVGTHQGKVHAMDAVVFAEGVEERAAVLNYLAIAGANFEGLCPSAKVDLPEAFVDAAIAEHASVMETAAAAAESVKVVATPRKKRGTA